jgi:hypothetical protein
MGIQFNQAGHNLMLDTFDNMTVGLFTGPNFDNDEVTGGAYARQPISFSQAANGTRTLTVFPEFDIPAGTTITHGALYVGAIRVADGTLTAPEQYNGAGSYTFTDGDLNLVAQP